ncbi:fatty-acyl-CoA synthase [Burkholderiales bacterium]|nr:fatty-acyl-CoA synthase [Burkholderiales bacterium]
MTGPPTLLERLREHAALRADATALESDRIRMSYAELDRDVRRLAGGVARLGIAPGAIVAIVVRGEVDHLLATLGLMAHGVAQVALSTRDPPTARGALAGRIGVTHVVGDGPADALPGLPWIPMDALRAAADAPSPAPEGRGDAPGTAMLYLTGSGTTGLPKIVRYTERDLAGHAARDYARARVGRVLRLAHVEFNNAKRMRLYTLWHGGTCVLRDGAAGSIHALCDRHRVDWIELSVLQAGDLLDACRIDGPLPDGTAIRVGGSRVPWTLRKALLAEATPALYVTYGATEVAAVAIAEPAMHDAREAVGPALAGVEVDVVREDGSPAATGEIGDIRIRAAGMARGYEGDAVASARHFRGGWFVPGDLASLTEDGLVCLHGRKDDMMNVNGINVFPAEIERVLESHPAVACAAAMPLRSIVHGQIPVAAVELRAGCACTPAELVRHARAALGMRAPRAVTILAALPRNAQGKIVKREIAGLAGASGC